MIMQTKRHAGFTLIEVLIAIAITAAVMTIVSTTFITTLRSQREVQSLTESTEAGSRILNIIERDLRCLWVYNIDKNRVFIGRNTDLNGQSADRIDFITSTNSISSIESVDEQLTHAPICEVGYWLRPNPKDPLLMELWRREDPMVDDNLLLGGSFQLVHDRLRNFSITYYATLGHSAEEIQEWDSSKEDSLPRRIKIEFTIERKLASANEVTHAEVDDFEDNNKKYTHHIVLDKEYMEVLKPDLAIIPVLPTRPTAGDPAAGPMGPAGGPAGPAGPAGPGGRGRGGPGGPMGARDGGTTEITQGGGRRNGAGNPGRGGAGRGGRGGNTGNPFAGRGNNVDINALFRQFGGSSAGSGGNPFGGLGGR